MIKNIVPVGMKVIGVGTPLSGEWVFDPDSTLRMITPSMNRDTGAVVVMVTDNIYNRPLNLVPVPNGFSLFGGHLETAYGVATPGDVYIAVGNGSPLIADRYYPGDRKVIRLTKNETPKYEISLSFVASEELKDKIFNCGDPGRWRGLALDEFNKAKVSGVTYRIIQK